MSPPEGAHPISSHLNSRCSLWIIIPFDFHFSTFQFRNLSLKCFPLLLSVSLSENVSFMRAGSCLLYSLLCPQHLEGCLTYGSALPRGNEMIECLCLSSAPPPPHSSEPGPEIGCSSRGSESLWRGAWVA